MNIATTRATSIRVPSTRPTISDSVSPHMIAGLKAQGLKSSQLVSRVTELHPIEDAVARLEAEGWKTTAISEHYTKLSLRPAGSSNSRPFPVGQTVTIYNRDDVDYDPSSDVVLSTSASGIEEQMIGMNARGKVTFNVERDA
ncbi:MAG: hypothetical protein HY319_26445 [Armatimonadetes bacterium]|nr:hypothetical protein [Armatimonadota bacterium]